MRRTKAHQESSACFVDRAQNSFIFNQLKDSLEIKSHFGFGDNIADTGGIMHLAMLDVDTITTNNEKTI